MGLYTCTAEAGQTAQASESTSHRMVCLHCGLATPPAKPMPSLHSLQWRMFQDDLGTGLSFPTTQAVLRPRVGQDMDGVG